MTMFEIIWASCLCVNMTKLILVCGFKNAPKKSLSFVLWFSGNSYLWVSMTNLIGMWFSKCT
jgi:hypothetical protein